MKCRCFTKLVIRNWCLVYTNSLPHICTCTSSSWRMAQASNKTSDANTLSLLPRLQQVLYAQFSLCKITNNCSTKWNICFPDSLSPAMRPHLLFSFGTSVSEIPWQPKYNGTLNFEMLWANTAKLGTPIEFNNVHLVPRETECWGAQCTCIGRGKLYGSLILESFWSWDTLIIA